MTIRDKLTTKGGNRGYSMVRSKYVKGPDGFGKVITLARETLIGRNGGKDPGRDVVAAHKDFGAHHSKDVKDQEATFKSRSWNTSESNMNRDAGISATDKLKLKNYQAPANKKKNLKDIIKKK